MAQKTNNLDGTIVERAAYELRVLCLRATTAAGSGHLTSCLSAADIVAALFFHTLREQDHFILSKGHAAPLLYAAWCLNGTLTEKELLKLRTFNSPLEGHPTPRFFGAEAATGSLGHGFGIALGIAQQNPTEKVFTLLGDGECAEGSVWEAAAFGAYYNLSNCIAIVDVNRLGQTGETMQGHHIVALEKKWRAFGWKPIVINGHSLSAVVHALDRAARAKIPTVILAKTIKGYGLSIADKDNFHGKALPQEKLKKYEKELAQFFKDSARTPSNFAKASSDRPIHKPARTKISIPLPKYKKNALIATRQAFGETLALLGSASSDVVVFDGDVSNSTYTNIFEKKFPTRFVQCFIAEQNMIAVAVGAAISGRISFAATFSAFLTRAYDQLRMAALSGVALRIIGSHSGVSIGEDGPSQMGLEDIALFRTLPESIVLSPCDAPSAAACTELMANYHRGISYLRTMRNQTPVIYTVDAQFEIGGCRTVMKTAHDCCIIIATGITVHEAIAAAQKLKKLKIFARVIDCYSIKPLPLQTLKDAVRACGKKVIIVEDHYPAGGLGEAIMSALASEGCRFKHLAVAKLPRSGKPEELRAYEEIDADAIMRAVKKLCS